MECPKPGGPDGGPHAVMRKRLWHSVDLEPPGSTTGEENTDTSEQDESSPLRLSWSSWVSLDQQVF